MDVICLPLGFRRRIDIISSAITAAVQHVVIFAAASNEGLNCTGPAYPARDEKVICINSAHYNGGESDDNPEPIGGQNLSTLGENVTSAWPIALSEANPEPMKATSGTSVATAIAAGIGALLLEFLRQDHEVPALQWAAKKMRTMEGMKVVLSDMAKNIHRFRYIEPFTYLDGSEDDQDLGSFSRRESALNKIFQILRNEFEYNPIGDSSFSIAPSAFDGLGLVPSSGVNFVSMEILGKGSYATVDKVRESSTGRYFARKRIYLDSTAFLSSEAMERTVVNEIKIMQKLRHRHISTIAFCNREEKVYSLFMEPIADCDLHIYLSLCTAKAFPKAMTNAMYPWFGCLVDALAYAHQSDIRHGDIKPSNILIKDSQPYLTDFGLAWDINQERMSRSHDHRMLGNPLYRAPEVMHYDSYDLDLGPDVFALGCVYSEMHTVMQQKSIAEYREFLRREDGYQCYRDCLYEVPRWLLLLKDGLPGDLLECQILNMMKAESYERITAAAASLEFSLYDDDSFFCGGCKNEDDLYTKLAKLGKLNSEILSARRLNHIHW